MRSERQAALNTRANYTTYYPSQRTTLISEPITARLIYIKGQSTLDSAIYIHSMLAEKHYLRIENFSEHTRNFQILEI